MPTDATFESFEKELNRLVESFGKRIVELKHPSYVEAQLRDDFLNPFFRALGWDMEKANQFFPATLTKNRLHRMASKLPPPTLRLLLNGGPGIGMALHAWDVARGKTIWREWSLTCPEKFNEHEFETSWHSFKPGGGVKLGTLFELAKGYGWRPKTSSRENPQPRQNETELSMPDWPAPPRPEVYHGVLREYVRKLEPHTEADPMAILIQLLVAVGNVVGRSAHFEVEADLASPCPCRALSAACNSSLPIWPLNRS
jgi:hypothetical protein